MLAIGVTAWIVFWVGFITGILWAAHKERRRWRNECLFR
jgi:hypothetical protein